MSLSEDLKFASDLALEAGKLVRGYFGKVERLTKRQAEAVSEADRASQRMIVAALNKRFPTDGIIGEENETGDAITFEVRDPLARNWVIDPIDGTNNFVAGLGAFAVCIGLLDKGEPVLGVVYDVARDLIYAAARGQGAYANGKKISVNLSPIGDATIFMLTSNLVDAKGNCPPFVSRWMSQTSWKVRIFGSAALEGAQVAAGVAHGALTLNGKLWDVVAPAAIIIEAGGLVTSPKGSHIFPFDLRNYSGAKVPFLAASPIAHDWMLREINS